MSPQQTTVVMPVGSILGITFIVLKLCGVIGWSWLWVLSPFWIPLAIVALCILLPLAAVAFVGLLAAIVSVCSFRK